jgi:5-formyltetrahydrofolate cyclo-ligase
MKKQELRQMMKKRLETLSSVERDEKSRRICELLVQQDYWQRGQVLCLFAAQSTEPNLDLLWQHPSSATKTFCYPRINGRQLDLVVVENLNGLGTSRWNLREPAHTGDALAPEAIDLLLVPGLAFAADGSRLGRGGGYYDRLIAHPQLRGYKIGICFDIQFLPQLPIEEHDREVDQVLTEKGLRL